MKPDPESQEFVTPATHYNAFPQSHEVFTPPWRCCQGILIAFFITAVILFGFWIFNWSTCFGQSICLSCSFCCTP